MSSGSQQRKGRKEMEEQRRLPELRINYGSGRSVINMRGSRAMVKIQTPRTDIVVRHRSSNAITSLDHCLPMYSGCGYNLERCFLTPSVPSVPSVPSMVGRPLKPVGPGQMPSDMATPVQNRDRDRFESIVCEALPKTVSRNRFPMIQKLKLKLKSKLKGKSKNQSKA